MYIEYFQVTLSCQSFPTQSCKMIFIYSAGSTPLFLIFTFFFTLLANLEILDGCSLVESVHPSQPDACSPSPVCSWSILFNHHPCHAHPFDMWGIAISYALNMGPMVHSWLGRRLRAIKAHAAGSCLAACPTECNRNRPCWISDTSPT